MKRSSFLVFPALLLMGATAWAQKPAVPKPAAPKPVAVKPSVSPAPVVKLSAERDSFHIMVNARAVGVSVFSVTPTATGFLVKENTSMPSMGMQNTEITTDAEGHPIKVAQTGLMGGQNVGINIDYASGHAKGSAKMPTGETIAIDAGVPANVIDDNMLQAVLPNLPWAPNAQWDLPVFSGGMNKLSTQTLVVTDEVPVAMPSGQVDAYRAELRSEGAVVAFYISKAAPHKVLKIAAGGAPFEFVRVN